MAVFVFGDASGARARQAASVLLFATGVLLLWAHVTLHPVPASFRELHADPPAPGEVVWVSTDAAWRVGEGEGGVALACVDQGCPFVIRVEPGFNASRFRPQGWVLSAAYPASAEWVPYEIRHDSDQPAQRALLLTEAVFDAEPLESPDPLLALAAAAALGGSALFFGAAFGAAGVAAAAGFLAHRAVSLTGLLAPLLVLELLAVVFGVGGLLLLAYVLAQPRRRAWAPVAALMLGFAAGSWLEAGLFDGYRPFTGIL